MNNHKKANIIALVHAFWMLWGFVSLPLVLLVPGYENVSLLFIGLTVASWAVWRGCLFLQLEKKLRAKHDPTSAYEGAFTAYYLNKYFGTHITTFGVRVGIYSFILVLLAASLIKKL